MISEKQFREWLDQANISGCSLVSSLSADIIKKLREEDYNDRINIEKRISQLETSLNEVKTNHIPHLEEKVDRIQWLLIVTLIGVVANLIQKFI